MGASQYNKNKNEKSNIDKNEKDNKYKKDKSDIHDTNISNNDK